MRDRRAGYEAAGAVVLGVSKDAPRALDRFDAGHELGFPLLSDADHAVAEAYGVWVEKSMYGKTFMGMSRSTFVIDGDGTIAHVIEKASPKTHDDEVLAALGQLSGATA